MTNEEKIHNVLKDFVSGLVPVQVLPAKVTKVDLDKETCDVKFLDEDLADHKGVHLTAGIGIETGLLLEPELDSVVYVGIVNNDSQWAFVSMFTKLASVKIRGKQYGGLIKIEDLVTRLNNVEKDLNTIKTAFKSWAVVPNDGGAALFALTRTWSGSNLELTKKSQIENTKVEHG